MKCEWVIVGSGNGLSSARRQAIAYTNADILLIGLSGKKTSVIFELKHSHFIQEAEFNAVCNMLVIWARPQCIDASALIIPYITYRFLSSFRKCLQLRA